MQADFWAKCSIKLYGVKSLFVISIVLLALASCGKQTTLSSASDAKVDKPFLKDSDTVRIASDKEEFEIIILDPMFNTWFNLRAKPRNFYSQSYLESRNRTWVSVWNTRAANPVQFGNMYDMPINYYGSVDYGYEVNYMLYNYLTYFQITFNQKLGGLMPRP